MLEQLLNPDGSPIMTAAAYSIAVIIVLVVWIAISWPFYIFYVAFKAMAQAAVAALFGAVKALFNLTMNCFKAVPGSFTAIADPKKLFAILPPRIEALRKAVLGSKAAVAKTANKHLQRLGAGGGGRSLVFKKVGQALKDLERVAAIDVEEIKGTSGVAGALMRTFLFTALALFAAVVNSFMLEQFFRSLLPGLTVPLVNWPLPLVLALVYTAIELSLGIVLEVQNARREREGLGFGVFQIIIISLIVPAVLLEIGFYTMLSFDIAWPWPEEWASQVPYWMNGWLGLMGIFIGGGVAVSGYAAGRQWEDMFRAFTINRLQSTITTLPPNLRAAQAALPQGGPVANTSVSASSDIVDQVEALQRKLEEVDAANQNLSQGTPVQDGDADAVRRRAVLNGILGPVAVLCSVVVFTDYLRGTPIYNFATWAPAVVAGLGAVLAMFAGDLMRGSVAVSSRGAQKESFNVNTTGGAILSRTIGGALALVLLVASVWAASSGGQNWNVGSIAWAVLVSGGCIGLGAFFLESIIAGIMFYLKTVLFSASSIVMFAVTAITFVPVLILKAFEIFVFGLLALPAIAVLRWRSDRTPPRQAAAPLRAVA